MFHWCLRAVTVAAFPLFMMVLTGVLPQKPELLGQMSSTQENRTQDNRPANCRVTLPSDGRFTPPSPYSAEPESKGVFSFWFGTEKLWTVLPTDGAWQGLRPYSPEETSLRQKLFWWRTGYNWKTETQPQLKVTGRRLDGMAPALRASDASNGHQGQDWNSFMVVAIDIPGCWEITGHYKGQELSFVIWVTAARPPAPHTP
jgi:hypothetical protein